MIRTETEYQKARSAVMQQKARLEDHRARLQDSGLKGSALKKAMQPLETFAIQLEEEVQSYERLKQGDVGELENLQGLGRALIGIRIARGLTQRELAERLGVNESTVSRDERNEYHGITVERAARILDALQAQCVSEFHLKPV